MKLPKPTASTIPSRNSKSSRQSLPGGASDDNNNTRRPSPQSHPNKPLELLNDEQLKKLTRQNTRKNNGGRKHRFRSHIERVCRRLDNLAVDVKLQHPTSIEALPVVSPCEEGCPSSKPHLISDHSPPHSLDDFQQPTKNTPDHESDRLERLETASDETSDIEPASNFGLSHRSSSEDALKSVRSVRISTSVTVLDYDASKKDSEPVSVSTLQRLEHPTRNYNPGMIKRSGSDIISFSRRNSHVRSSLRASLSFHKSDEGNGPDSSPKSVLPTSDDGNDSYSQWTRSPHGPFGGNPYRQQAACYYGADVDSEERSGGELEQSAKGL